MVLSNPQQMGIHYKAIMILGCPIDMSSIPYRELTGISEAEWEKQKNDLTMEDRETVIQDYLKKNELSEKFQVMSISGYYDCDEEDMEYHLAYRLPTRINNQGLLDFLMSEVEEASFEKLLDTLGQPASLPELYVRLNVL